MFRSAAECLSAMRTGEVSSLELTEESIARIEAHDREINALCVRDFDRARHAAHQADRARREGREAPLLGVPVTVKECFDITGLPTTWGMPQHRHHYPAADAVQVERIKAAGAVVLGKTNVPLGLQDLQSFNDIHGTTRNPWCHDRTPGGSSGGSAAALACGFGALSLGSDLAGSLRTPAHFCGIYAHKPTLGLAATRGMVAPGEPALPVEQDLAVVGPMARTAGDLALLLEVMAGPDPLTHGKAHRLRLPPARHPRLEDFRVLVLDEHPLIATSAAVRAGVERVAAALGDGGARVDRGSALLPDLAEAARIYTQLLFSGSTAHFPLDAYDDLRDRAAHFDAGDRSLEATRWRAMVCSHRDWMHAHRLRELHRHRWRRVFTEFDVVACPITPTPAFGHDHDPDLLGRRIDVDGVGYPFFDQLVWAGLATMPGLPATAIPTGPDEDGLPVGIQLIGPAFEDRTPLHLAALLDQRLGGFRAPGTSCGPRVR
ncbi:amidase [Saccharopolyspora flava]|uniref:Amidase n=1 Tax=Saccharopolyspora flava TaxID=95161 RepID=A0A1I6SW81_9PSEU|nr:amidase [Saccharopolyspora flava]SFS81215.1 amidase [Saccharopolyspora flava]